MGNTVIAKNGDLILYAKDDTMGYVHDTSTGKDFDTHMIISILSKGVWNLISPIIVRKGGAGSGNKGHAGRPGKRGGSMPGGSTASTSTEDNPVAPPSQNAEATKWANAHPGETAAAFMRIKSLGVKLKLEDPITDPYVSANLLEMNKLPDSVLKIVADNKIQVILSNDPYPEMDTMQYLRGTQPRGWPAGKTFDQVCAAYNDRKAIVAAGHVKGDTRNAILHELGHVLWYRHVLTNPGLLKKVQTAYKSEMHKPLNPYYKQPGLLGMNELFSQSLDWHTFSKNYLDRNTSTQWANMFDKIIKGL